MRRFRYFVHCTCVFLLGLPGLAVAQPQNATGNFTKIVQRIPVRIQLNPGPATRALLVPGMSVEVSVDTRSARDAADRIAKEQEAHNERIGRK